MNFMKRRREYQNSWVVVRQDNTLTPLVLLFVLPFSISYFQTSHICMVMFFVFFTKAVCWPLPQSDCLSILGSCCLVSRQMAQD